MRRIGLHFYTLHIKGQKAHRLPETGLSDGKELLEDRVQQYREKEKEAELCLSVSDLLSLAGFRTKFTSFHDIQHKAQLSVQIPSQNTQGLDR